MLRNIIDERGEERVVEAETPAGQRSHLGWSLGLGPLPKSSDQESKGAVFQMILSPGYQSGMKQKEEGLQTRFLTLSHQKTQWRQKSVLDTG